MTTAQREQARRLAAEWDDVQRWSDPDAQRLERAHLGHLAVVLLETLAGEDVAA